MTDSTSRRFGTRHYVLILLMGVHALQYLDRQTVVILIEPIKAEFALSDSQIGLLTGLAFSIPYSILLLPVGFLVDRYSRRNILVTALAIWSALTAATGLVRNYVELMLTRGVIAAAESASNPGALSLLSDFFDRKSRVLAIGIYYSGPSLSIVAGFILLGLIAENFGWRIAFFVAGMPGLLLALVILLTTKEPQREGSSANEEAASAPTVRETMRFVSSQRSLVHFMIAITLTATATSGQIAFQASFLMRVHGLSLATSALVIGIAFGLSNACGQIAGGWLVSRMARADVARVSWCTAAFAAVCGMLMATYVFADRAWLAIGLLALWALPAGCQYGPVMGTVQSLVMPRMRGMTNSFVSLLMYLIGAGLGPLIVGVLSDRLSPGAGAQSLRYAMAVTAGVQLLAAVHFFLASRSLRADVDRVQSRIAVEAA
ncbi:MAG: MFS transporter [Steroidobacteraceae bacterium]